MAIAAHLKTFSLIDLAVAPLSGESPGSLVDMPGIQSMEVNITTEQVELRGDGKIISTVDDGHGIEWSTTEGGISFAALQVLTGKTFVDTGTTPNVVRRLDVKGQDRFPYFYITGKAVSDDNAQDLWVVVWKAKCTDNIELTLEDGEFLTPGFGGTGIARDTEDLLVSLVHHETKATQAVLTP